MNNIFLLKQNWRLYLLFTGVPITSISGNNDSSGYEKPNILVFLADDLGTHELSCYGGENIVTPNIDRLANEGMLFSHNYASATMSVPIRASLYTGLYPVRHGSYQNHKSSNPDIKSITNYLPELGYRVGRSGKRHSTPKSVYDFVEIPGFEVDCVSKTAHFSTDRIKEFIITDEQPFCLFVCSIHPHVPWTWGDKEAIDSDKIVLPPNFVDNPDTRNIYRDYLAEINALDKEVGSVIKMLEETGKLNNTLIIFLGEQGPQFPFGKWTCYRYGQHSAFIARYPDKIEAGRISNAMIQYEDILPTLIDFCGGDIVKEMDGRSFLEVLYGNKEEHRNWVYGIHNNIPEGTAYPIRSIQNKKYKLIMNLTPEVNYFEKHLMNANIRGQGWNSWLESAKDNPEAKSLVDRYVKRPALEFYDIENDPWELINLADNQQYAEIISMMENELNKWMLQQEDKGVAMDIPF